MFEQVEDGFVSNAMGVLWKALSWLVLFSGLVLLIALVMFLVGLAPDMEPTGRTACLRAGHYFMFTTFCLSLVMAFDIWGVTGVFIGLLLGGAGILPVAILATATHEAWLALTLLCLFPALAAGDYCLGGILDARFNTRVRHRHALSNSSTG